MVKIVTKCCLLVTLFLSAKGEVTCPEKNGDVPAILPDSKDCTKFYICDNGRPWGQTCSDGLYFNPQIEVCDRPENVTFCEYDDLVYIKPHCDCTKYVICDYGVVNVNQCANGYHANLTLSESTNDDPCQAGDC